VWYTASFPSSSPALEDTHKEMSQGTDDMQGPVMEQKVVEEQLGWGSPDTTLLVRTKALQPWDLEHISTQWSLAGQSCLADCSLAVVFHIKHNWLQISTPEQHSLLCNNLLKTHFTKVQSTRKTIKLTVINLHLSSSIIAL
jgi:hypothetical protein